LSGARAPAADVVVAQSPGYAVLTQRLLNLVLFVTILTSSVAFIEPSPHDGLMAVLLAACVVARVSFDRKLIPLLALLSLWIVGGLLTLIQIGDNQKAIQYVGTSLYLDVAAIMFACLFSTGDAVRLSVMRRAYILAALIASAAGYIGFFHLLPGSDVFLDNERVSATFKDPNVFGPFLIFPLLMLMIGFMTRGFRVINLALMGVIAGALLLSFSRGAWIHFVLSATIAVAVLLKVTPDPRLRARILMFALVAAIGAALFIIALMSIDSVNQLFMERAKAIQPYDVGPGGRFWQQQLALGAILDHPNGMGPFEFDRVFGLQQHNVYMQGFLVYGWLGGMTYLTLVAVTLVIGLRAMIVPTAWQYYLVAAYAFFAGEAFEGLIVDTDHWRHFYLALGLVWGLTVATINVQRDRAWEDDEAALRDHGRGAARTRFAAAAH
jgi:hypothetical protein